MYDYYIWYFIKLIIIRILCNIIRNNNLIYNLVLATIKNQNCTIVSEQWFVNVDA